MVFKGLRFMGTAPASQVNKNAVKQASWVPPTWISWLGETPEKAEFMIPIDEFQFYDVINGSTMMVEEGC